MMYNKTNINFQQWELGFQAVHIRQYRMDTKNFFSAVSGIITYCQNCHC